MYFLPRHLNNLFFFIFFRFALLSSFFKCCLETSPSLAHLNMVGSLFRCFYKFEIVKVLLAFGIAILAKLKEKNLERNLKPVAREIKL